MPRLHQNHTRLTGAEREYLSDVLIDAFDVDSLDTMLANKLDRRRQRITLARSLDSIIFDLIEDAEMKSWSAELLVGARAARPTHVGLFRAAQSFDLEPQTPSTDQLEQIIRPELGSFDPVPWLGKLMALLGRICRVEIATTPIRGTGFLVAPDMVLTNYHVVEQVIEWQRAQSNGTATTGPALPPRLLKCRFDHKVLSDSLSLAAGQVVDLHATEWLIDYSPYGQAPFDSTPADRLDYALLHLKTAVGDQVVDETEKTRRGWVGLPALDPELPEGAPLFILGHPLGDSLKLSLDTNAVIACNELGTRIRYSTNTQAGSSGSPCFTRDWTLAALHHAGGNAINPTYNEGIPIAAIRSLWLDRLSGDWLEPWQLDRLERLLSV